MRSIIFTMASLLFSVVQANAQNSAMTFTLSGNGGNCTGCEWVSAEGTITQDTPDILRAYIEQNGKIYDISFNSPGGNLFAGFEIGRILRQQEARVSIARTVPMPEQPQWETQEDGVCVSACAYAFLGGQLRWVDNGELGFHQFFDKRAMANPELQLFNATDRILDQLVTGEIVKYLGEMGIDLRLYELAASVPPGEIAYLTRMQAEDLGVLNTYDNPAEDWRLLPYEDGLVAETLIRPRIGNPQPSRLRFYCSKGRHYLTLLASSDPYGNAESILPAWQEAYDRSGPRLSVSGAALSSKIEGLYPSSDGLTIAIVIALDKSSATLFEKQSKLESDWFVLGRAQSSAFSIWDIGEIPGDPRTLKLAMKNCVN